MKRQGTMYQMKEQDKTPEKQLNEAEIGGLCDGCGWKLSSLTNAWMLFYEAKLFQMNK